MKVRRGLAAEQALQIAPLVAEAAYGDLDDFRMTIARQADGCTSIMSRWIRRATVGAPIRQRCVQWADSGQAL